MKIFFLTLLCLLFFNCGNDSVDEQNIDCHPNVPNSSKGQFVLSLSLNKCFEKVTQTVFVENKDKAKDSTIFAIGCKIGNLKFSDGAFKNLKLKEFDMKPIIGNNLKINSVSYQGRNASDEKRHDIEIIVEKSNIPLGWNRSVTIDSINTTDFIEIGVRYKDEHGIGPRICTNYIGSID